MLDRKVGFFPRQVARHAHFVEPRLAPLPAEMDEVFSGRADHVGHASDEIAPAVAVVIDSMHHVFRRHHLRLAEFTRPRSDHFVRTQIAALDQPQCVEQMPAKHVRTPAVVGQRRQRFDRLILALPGAEIALQAPKSRDDRGRHAELILFASKQRLVFFDLRGAVGQTAVAQHLVGHLDKILREESLTSIDVDDALIEHKIRRSRRNGGLRNALGESFFFEISEPGFEAAGVAAVRLAQSRCRKRRQQGCGKGESSSHSLDRHYHPSQLPVRCVSRLRAFRGRTACSRNANSPILTAARITTH